MKKSVFIAMLALLSAAPALAQSQAPAWDFSAGYSLVRDSDAEETFNGWLLSAASNLTPLVGIVGEMGGNYKSFGSDVKLSLYSFMAGPRVQSRTDARFTPYGQLLLGVARGSVEVDGNSDSETDVALQPGAGIDWWFQSNAGVRLGVDYRRIFSEGDGTNQFRFHVGIVLTGGSR